MLLTYRIAFDPTNKQETLLPCHAGHARFAWNRGLEDAGRALDAGEAPVTRRQPIRPLSNTVKAELAPLSRNLSPRATTASLIAVGENSRVCARSHKHKRVMETLRDCTT